MFLDTIFRRLPTEKQVEKYVEMTIRHHKDGHRFEGGIDFTVGTSLCSRNFL
ncbi:MAG TPA: hypothetical protein DEF45_01935 [Rhodopirellula sp.]|nr:MAG: hypothetical protein CBD74_04045 [Saprospirales bacterium TMED214]HBV61758.1 hypothetical protein [Rhodopirellula sp.]